MRGDAFAGSGIVLPDTASEYQQVDAAQHHGHSGGLPGHRQGELLQGECSEWIPFRLRQLAHVGTQPRDAAQA